MYKLFVGGISQETSEMDLRSHFSRFGSITKASIIYDKRTSRLALADASKGFGFIESDNRKTIERIFEVKVHFLKGRYVDVNRALDKHSQVPSDILERGFKKLFVGGLSSDTTDDDLFEYFSSFAPVFKAYVIYDPNTSESKSRLSSPDFGYVEFESVEDAESVLLCGRHNLHGRRLTVENQKNGLLNSLSIKHKQQQIESLQQDSSQVFSSEGNYFPPLESRYDRDCPSMDESEFSSQAQLSKRLAGTLRSNHLPVVMDRYTSSSFTLNHKNYSREAVGPQAQHPRRPKLSQMLQEDTAQSDPNISSPHFFTHAIDDSNILIDTQNRNHCRLLNSQLYVFRSETETSRSCRVRRIDWLLARHAGSYWPHHASIRREHNA